MESVIILGTGCAGLTAAIYTARANLRPLVLEGSQPGGQLTTTSEVENFPGFPEGVDGYELTQRMRKQAERFGARFAFDQIESVSLSPGNNTLRSSKNEYKAKAVIVATGARPRLLNIPGEKELYGGKGVTTCATCDGAFYRDLPVAIVGGGDSACEEALFLTRFASSVHLIHRRDTLRASPIMADRVLKHPKITCVWNSALEEVLGVENDSVRGARVKNLVTGDTSEIAFAGLFIAIGHIPNTNAFQGQLDLDSDGYFIPAEGSQVRTKVPGVFVAGDCSDHHYRQAITAAGMGCQAAIDSERWLAEHS